MPIIRGKHEFDDHYTQIPNAWLRDERLSYKARGLLAELMSHRPGWSVSIESMASRGPDGRDAIRSAVKELEAVGYLRREQTREGGKFGETDWVTCDPPSSGFPSSVFPSSDNPTPKNTITKEQQDKETLSGHEAEPDWRSSFDEFWSVYPRRDKKARAATWWRTRYLRGELDTVAVIAGARRYANDPNRVDQFTQMPETWLNAAGWLSDPLPARRVTLDEKLEQARREAEMDRERRLRASEALTAEYQEMKAKAVPAPRCEHGKPLPLCLPCSKRLAADGA